MNTIRVLKWAIAGALLSGAVAAGAFGLTAQQSADHHSSPTPLFRITSSPISPSPSRRPSPRFVRKYLQVPENSKGKTYDCAMSLEAGQTFAGYTILRVLGTGGVGQGYPATTP